MNPLRTKEVMQDAARAAPAVGTSGGILLGMPLSDWVLYATLIYTALQIWALLYKWFWKKKDDKAD